MDRTTGAIQGPIYGRSAMFNFNIVPSGIPEGQAAFEVLHRLWMDACNDGDEDAKQTLAEIRQDLMTEFEEENGIN